MSKYVKCPEQFEDLFVTAEGLMEGFFAQKEWNPLKGEFNVGGERYVMYRAESLSVHLRGALESLVGSGAEPVLYRFGRACGQADAEHFFMRFPEAETFLKMAFGPVVFSMCGYARVEILEGSSPSPDENFLLIYDHTNVYESQAYLKRGVKRDLPVDSLNAGYSAGWCSEAIGVRLESKEITCVAKGDPQCRFVLAHHTKLRDRVKDIM